MFFSQTDNISELSHIDAWLSRELWKININPSLVKTFKKSYYEIRYNLDETDYIPNFDKYDIDQKKEVLFTLSQKKREEIDAMDVQLIDHEFGRLIGREVSELERDLVDAFS